MIITGYIPNNYGYGVIDYIRRRLYNNITPKSYYKPVERVWNAVVNNEPDSPRYVEPIASKDIREQLDDIWATYLQIPEKDRKPIQKRNRLVSNNDGTYALGYTGTIYDTVMEEALGSDKLIDYKGNGHLHRFYYPPMALGEYRWLNRGDVFLGDFGIRRGYDNNGEYILYEDLWNVSPYKITNEASYPGMDTNLYGQPKNPSIKDRFLKFVTEKKDDASFGIGHPIPIKGKFYLDDYYGVKNTHSTYLPEVTIRPRKK